MTKPKKIADENDVSQPVKEDKIDDNTVMTNRIERLEDCCKFLLSLCADIAREQANRTFSGSRWLVEKNHAIKLVEAQMGWGEGPATDKPC